MSDVSLSRDGKRVAFKRWSDHMALHVADLHAGGTQITNERDFTGSESNELWADWTTDSKGLIFVSNRTGRAAIYRQALIADTPNCWSGHQVGLRCVGLALTGGHLSIKCMKVPNNPRVHLNTSSAFHSSATVQQSSFR
jgi:hypothetical protein